MQQNRHQVEQPRLARLVQCRADHPELGQILAAKVDEDLRAADRVRSDQAALEQPMRNAQHDLAILERARLRLVGVDSQVGRFASVLG